MSFVSKADALDQLKAGVKQLTESGEWLRFLDVQRRFHQYSWGNCLLIAHQCPGATYVAGYHRWRDLGRQVRKGEKGIMILARIVARRKRELVDGKDELDSNTVLAYRAVYVFDVSQTEGEALPLSLSSTRWC